MPDAATTTNRITPLPTLPGHFHFADVHTSDVEGAKAFYGALCGWQFEEVPGAPNRYVTAGIDGRGKAAITGLTDEQRASGVTSYWLPYLWVDDVDATYAKVDGLGGTAVMEPMDIFDFGRMALIQDSTGAWLGLWQDLNPDSTIVKDEHGSPFWFQLNSTDVDDAVEFYRGLVGWTTNARQMGPDMVYHLIVPEQVDEHQRNAGGIMRLTKDEQVANAPSSWNVYINVDDVDAAHAKALELGATSVMTPHDIPGSGRSCWIIDPQGAYLALMTPSPRD